MQIKRRNISLLLILAMMTVALVSLLPLTAAADPVGDNAADIQDFSYQTLSNANQTDATTDLRVMFTISSLDYDAVGFVFSTSNSAPTAGGAGTYSTTTVHSTINAGGGNIPAGEGRFWVAVKLSAIPLASFETPIYVRPFIQVGENYSYIDAATITVCQALTYDKTVAGESAIFDSKTAENVSNGDPNYGTGSYYLSMLAIDYRGGKHFFPTTSDPDGNDLWFEYSLLWNPTLANLDSETADPVITLASFRKQNGDGGTYKDFFRIATRSGVAECPYAGKINFGAYKTRLSPTYSCVLDPGNGQPLYRGALDDSVSESSYPSIGEDGWHRIGFRFHQEVTIDNDQPYPSKAKPTVAAAVVMSGFSELYIDGVLVWKIQANVQGTWVSTEWKDRAYGLRINDITLFQARDTAYAGYTQYGDYWYIDNAKLIVEMKIQNILEATNAVYVAISDVHLTCGDGFVRQVSPVADPVDDHQIVLDDKGTADPSDDVTCSGKIWYVFDN